MRGLVRVGIGGCTITASKRSKVLHKTEVYTLHLSIEELKLTIIHSWSNEHDPLNSLSTLFLVSRLARVAMGIAMARSEQSGYILKDKRDIQNNAREFHMA